MGVRRIAALLSGSVLLVGCGSGGGQGVTVTAQVPVTVTAATDASLTPAATTAAPVPLGSSQTWGDVTMTVHAVDRNAAPVSYENTPRTAVDIEACAHAPGVKVSGIRWALQDAAGGRYTPPSYVPDPILPEYPADRGVDVLNGECFRGWLVVDAPVGAALTTVRYSPVDQNNQVTATLFWSIPA